jgi:hypothetical protein
MSDFNIHTGEPVNYDFEDQYLPVEAWRVPFNRWGMCMIFACNSNKSGMISALTNDESEYFVFQDSSYESEMMMRKMYAIETFEPSPFEYTSCYGTIMGRRCIVHLSVSLSEHDESENLLTTSWSKIQAFKINLKEMLDNTEADTDDSVLFRVIFNTMGRNIHLLGMSCYNKEITIADYNEDNLCIEGILDEMIQELRRIENSGCNYNWALCAEIESTNESVEVSLDSLNVKRTY